MLGFKDLTSRVGEFLFLWSALELELARSILTAEGHEADLTKVRGNLKDRLDRWKCLQFDDGNNELALDVADQIERLRPVRNLIVHDLAGGHSAPNDGAEPYIECVEGGWQSPTGEKRKITVSELEHYIEAVDACRRGIRHPSNFNYRL